LIVPGARYTATFLEGLEEELQKICRAKIKLTIELTDQIKTDNQIKRKAIESLVT
jgi:hypothetical protein